MNRDDHDDYQFVSDKEELREILGPVAKRAAAKEHSELHRYHRDWLDASTFLLVATSDRAGNCDLSPKGDPSGFTHIVDKRTIVIPERPGNRRADGFHNVLENPHAGLLFMIAGRGETLRINGRARLLRDAAFFDQMIVKGHRPALALLLEIDTIFFHCSKAFLRSGLWQPDSWQPDALPPRATIAHAMERSDQSYEEVVAHYDASYGKGLY